MDNNDKLIKDLLKEGFLTEAPQGFTEKVMNAVAEREESKAHFPITLSYFLLIAGSMFIAAGSIYFTDKELLFQYFAETGTFFSGIFTSSFQTVSNSFSFISGSQAGFFAGILLIIALLLLLDKLVFSKKQEMSMFISFL